MWQIGLVSKMLQWYYNNLKKLSLTLIIKLCYGNADFNVSTKFTYRIIDAG